MKMGKSIKKSVKSIFARVLKMKLFFSFQEIEEVITPPQSQNLSVYFNKE